MPAVFNKQLYQPADPNQWQGRIEEKAHQRLFQQIECIDFQNQSLTSLKPNAFGLIGFCCDEGVKRNQGRVGAQAGPITLRKSLANLPIHQEEFTCYDLGNILCQTEDLEASQGALAQVINEMLQNHMTPIVLGGGHETAWGHYQGIAHYLGQQPLSICNFDAHFDLRDLLPENKGSSGTPFWQIYLDSQQHKKPFNYHCYGIQQDANMPYLFDRAEALNVHYIYADDFHWSDGTTIDKNMTTLLKSSDKIYLTICLDVFAACFAPGVSANQPLGLYPSHVVPLIRQLAQSGKVISFDVVELCPRLDRDNITAKLGAVLIAEFMRHYM